MTTKPKKLVMKPSMFTFGDPRLSVTKSWVTNNHWCIHKSLLADPLTWLTLDTAMAWLKGFKSLKDVDASSNTEEGITIMLKRWKFEGTLYLAPEPLPGTYSRRSTDTSPIRVVAYQLPNEIVKGVVGVPKLCVFSSYYNALRPHLTHMLHVPSKDRDRDKIADTSLCNEDLTVLLRPMEGVPDDQLERVKRSRK